ncbi:hypothetical protein CISG_07363 [Coccidioides immitis RMSCC 3703]|uniref:Uncharacterized protein n=2 Tax=Coccidioides immitis TaxID=5501 RepID=A0A0J8R2R6_COCIT|nr:hypothetical protein CIRG_07590 [Coccidioides immitis RMSCC 2394]KMU79056.1 hypothetical protein CISG_07363 [Coccidioides immitis RMSCC 3703]
MSSMMSYTAPLDSICSSPCHHWSTPPEACWRDLGVSLNGWSMCALDKGLDKAPSNSMPSEPPTLPFILQTKGTITTALLNIARSQRFAKQPAVEEDCCSRISPRGCVARNGGFCYEVKLPLQAKLI